MQHLIDEDACLELITLFILRSRDDLWGEAGLVPEDLRVYQMALLLGLGEVADDEPRGTGWGGARLCGPQALGGPPGLVVDEQQVLQTQIAVGDVVGFEVLQARAELQQQQTHLPLVRIRAPPMLRQGVAHKVGHRETGHLSGDDHHVAPLLPADGCLALSAGRRLRFGAQVWALPICSSFRPFRRFRAVLLLFGGVGTLPGKQALRHFGKEVTAVLLDVKMDSQTLPDSQAAVILLRFLSFAPTDLQEESTGRDLECAPSQQGF